MHEAILELSIEVVSSASCNGHEVRLRGDHLDLVEALDNGMIGMDPDDLLAEPRQLLPGASGRITVGRCDCGEVGCGSVAVDFTERDGLVRWRAEGGAPEFVFDATQYRAEVQRAVGDHRWESPDRTAARLVREGVQHAVLARHGLRYEWTSGRIDGARLTVSATLEAGPYQLLLHVPFDPADPAAGAAAALAALHGDPRQWRDVDYYPQGQRRGPPAIAHASWRHGGR